MKKILGLKTLYTILTITFGFSTLINAKTFTAQARKEQTQLKDKDVTEQKPVLTPKRWFMNKMIQDIDNENFNKLSENFSNLSEREKADKNNTTMKKCKKFCKKYMDMFQKNLDEKKLSIMLDNSQKNTKQSYNMPDKLKEIFKYFWDVYKNKLEKEYVMSKIPKVNDLSNKQVFISPTFGFTESGAIIDDGKIKTGILNAKLAKEAIDSLLEKGYEVWIPFSLEYAGITLKNDKNLHTIFKERPRILGKSGKGNIFEATSLCMRCVVEKLFKNEKSTKPNFVSINLGYNSSSDTKTIGPLIYFQQDENTSEKTQKNSVRLAKILYKKWKDICKIKKDKKNIPLTHGILKEDWAVANTEDVSRSSLKYNIALINAFSNHISNKKEKNECIKKSNIKKTGQKLAEAVEEYFEK